MYVYGSKQNKTTRENCPSVRTQSGTAVLSAAFYLFSVSLALSRSKEKQIILVLGSNANHFERMKNISIDLTFYERSHSSNGLESILKTCVISVKKGFLTE